MALYDDPDKYYATFAGAEVTLGKLEAARRLLATAIELWFNEGDPVSINLLAHSAYEVIHRLARNAGVTDLLYDSQGIPDDQRNAYAMALKKPASFFKHASKDPREQLVFNPASNMLFLLAAVLGVHELTDGKMNQVERAYFNWTVVHYPQWHLGRFDPTSGFPVDKLDQIRSWKRSEFLQNMLRLD